MKKKRNKITLVFDEEKRREFLTGFHKRKLERKRKAQEKFAKELKEERKRIKTEAKESYKKLVVSHRPIPELEKYTKQEYDEEDVTVQVLDFTNNSNQDSEGSEDDDEEEKEQNESDEEVPGMELHKKVKRKVEVKEAPTVHNKDIKKTIKKQATKSVKKSKIFQKKNKLERQKAKKKSMYMKRDYKAKSGSGKNVKRNRNFKSRKQL